MAWYTILFFVVFALFAFKLILSWMGGDLEMDVDFDGVDDFDTSAAFSFKGLIHFLLGFSSYLFLRANMAEVDKINGVAQFGILDYIMATVIGVVIMFMLFYGYKLAMKANNSSKDPSELIDNCKGKIYINLGNGQYSVEAHTLAGTTNVTAYYSENNLEPGTEVILEKEGNNIFIKYLENDIKGSDME